MITQFKIDLRLIWPRVASCDLMPPKLQSGLACRSDLSSQSGEENATGAAFPFCILEPFTWCNEGRGSVSFELRHGILDNIEDTSWTSGESRLSAAPRNRHQNHSPGHPEGTLYLENGSQLSPQRKLGCDFALAHKKKWDNDELGRWGQGKNSPERTSLQGLVGAGQVGRPRGLPDVRCCFVDFYPVAFWSPPLARDVSSTCASDPSGRLRRGRRPILSMSQGLSSICQPGWV